MNRNRNRRRTRTNTLTMLAVATIAAAMSTAWLRAQTPQDDILNSVRLDQRLGETVPKDVRFVNEKGDEVAISEYFTGRPVVLVPVFYRCPMLCTQILSALVRTTAGQSLNPGEDFTVVVFSIDPRETPGLAIEKKLQYLKQIPRPAARHGWHFLVGQQESIQRLTESIGYHYAYDKERDQFAHPAAITILTPDGVISRYLVGLDYTPKDLRLSLVEASDGAIGDFVDQVLLRCYCYDPESGRYGFAIMTALRLGGALTIATLGAAILWMSLRRRKREANWAATVG